MATVQPSSMSFVGLEDAVAFGSGRWVQVTKGAGVDRVRCVLLHDQRYLLAQHNTRRVENRSRWGLVGGRLKRGEEPATALRRELIEELGLRARQLVELGDWVCRGETHRIFGGVVTAPVYTFDPDEICAIGWFTHAEVIQLARSGSLHRGFEARAIAAFRAMFAT